MIDDRQAAELITRALTQQLSVEQQSELEAHLAQSATTRNFAELTKAIQAAAAGNSEMDSTRLGGARLSDLARARLQRCLKGLMESEVDCRDQEVPDQRRVAEAEGHYEIGGPPATKAEPENEPPQI